MENRSAADFEDTKTHVLYPSMNHTRPVDQLADSDLLASLHALATRSNRTMAELLAHLAEVDRRQLHLDQACSSLFRYCTERLGFSEHAAYKRIALARASRRFPILLEVVRGKEPAPTPRAVAPTARSRLPSWSLPPGATWPKKTTRQYRSSPIALE
jgi:hypothetical protein